MEQQCRPRRGRTKTGENSRNKEAEMRKRQRMHSWRGNCRRKTGSNLITASFHSSLLFLLIVSQFPASVSFSITYRIFYFSGFPFLCISLRFSLSSPFAGSLSFFFFISVQSLHNCRSQQEIFSLWEKAAGRISGNIPFYRCCVSQSKL